MALLWVDGFESYAAASSVNITTMIGRRYASVNGTITTCGAPNGLGVTGGGGAYLMTPTLTTNATLAVGLRFNPVWSTTAAHSIIQLYDGGTLGIDVQWNPLTQEITVLRGSTALGTTTGANLTPSTWMHIEVKVKCDGSAGTVEVRVAGVTKLLLTGQNTKAGTDSYHNAVRFYFGSNGGNGVDSAYITDGSGSVNNDFLGLCNVVGLLLPTTDSSVAWTTSSGSTHYSLVNENPPNDDTSWVSSATSGQTDLYGYTQVAYGAATIIGVQLVAACRVTDTNTYNLLMPVYSGTQSDGTAQTVSITTYSDFRRIIETDPNTGVAWTPTALNAATFGVKVQ
jgi:hypothetical protein